MSHTPKVSNVLLMLADDEFRQSYGTVDHPASVIEKINTVFDSCENKRWDVEKQIAKFEKVIVKHTDLIEYATTLTANAEFLSNWECWLER